MQKTYAFVMRFKNILVTETKILVSQVQVPLTNNVSCFLTIYYFDF